MSNEDITPRITDEGEVFTAAPIPDVPQTPQESVNAPVPSKLTPEYMASIGGIPGILGKYKKPLIIILIIIGVVLGAFLAFNAFSNPQQTLATPTPTPTLTVTPTPMRHMAPAATTSAYLKFEMSLASLSGTLEAVQITDSTLTPPTVELPLGFPNQ